MAANLNRPGLGFEAAAVALSTNRGFDGFFIILDFHHAGHTQPAAIRAGALRAVKGKQPRIERLQTDAAGRAGSGKAENFLVSVAVQKCEAAPANFKRLIHQ